MLNKLKDLSDMYSKRLPWGVFRSKYWPTTRKEFLKSYSRCAACETTNKIEVHHIVPYHIDESLEHHWDNLIPLCRSCHLVLGHKKNWKLFEPDIIKETTRYRMRRLEIILNQRKYKK